MIGRFRMEFSEVFAADLQDLAEGLNACGEWSICGGRFVATEVLRYSHAEVFGLQTRPRRAAAMRVSGPDGRSRWLNPASVSYPQALATLEVRFESVPLCQVSRLVASSLLTGTLVIRSERVSERSVTDVARLEIHADGRVALFVDDAFVDEAQVRSFEEYVP